MAIQLGWKPVITARSEVYRDMVLSISAMPIVDVCTRVGNEITYSINVVLKLDNGVFWDYIWQLDTNVGGKQDNNKLVKPSTAWRQRIVGKWYYMSSYSSPLTGKITVNKNATVVPITLQYHDSNRNVGGQVVWYMNIPPATAPDGLMVEAKDITDDSINLDASVKDAGKLAVITKWKLEYGPSELYGTVIEEDGDTLTKSWNVEDLEPSTRYFYKVTVYNNLGFSSEYTGYFDTEDRKIAYKITKAFKVGDLIQNSEIEFSFPDYLDYDTNGEWKPLLVCENGNLLEICKDSTTMRIRAKSNPQDQASEYRLVYGRNLAYPFASINEKKLSVGDSGRVTEVGENKIMQFISGNMATDEIVMKVKCYSITQENGKRKVKDLKIIK